MQKLICLQIVVFFFQAIGPLLYACTQFTFQDLDPVVHCNINIVYKLQNYRIRSYKTFFLIEFFCNPVCNFIKYIQYGFVLYLKNSVDPDQLVSMKPADLDLCCLCCFNIFKYKKNVEE